MTAMVHVACRSGTWRKALPGADRLGRRAARAVLGAVSIGRRSRCELGIVLADDRFVRRLNRDYRGKDRPTNVLSFASGDGPLPPTARRPLGDIVLALGTLRREAREQDKSLRDHFAHLVVHGVLHLCGHDHVEPRRAARMERIERRVLATLGVPDPYEPRDVR